MQLSSIRFSGDSAGSRRFGDAFGGGDCLRAPGREFLTTKLEGHLEAAHDDPLSCAELGDVNDPKRCQELRSWFESALALGWDRSSLGSRILGDLAPPARLVADGRIGPRSLDQRARSVLERAGCARWSELLAITVAQLLDVTNLGPTMVAGVLGAVFERSLAGLGAAVDDADGSDLAVLLATERRRPEQPVLEALLESAAGFGTARATVAAGTPAGPGAEIAEDARRILANAAPWALTPASALVELLLGITDEQDRSIFARVELAGGRRASLAALAAELDISSSRIAQRRDRAAAQVRDELAAAPAPLEWLVRRVRRCLGRLTTQEAAAAELGVHGLGATASQADTGEATALLLWLAGPYEPVTRCAGWIGVQPDEVVARTKEMLAEDGGVVPLRTINAALKELGVADSVVAPWLEACGGTVVDGDLAVLLSGGLNDVLERIVDAYGRSQTADECREVLSRGGRTVDQPELERALRGRRFRRVAGDAYELASWPPNIAGKVARRSRNRSEHVSPHQNPREASNRTAAREQSKIVPPSEPSISRSDLSEQLGLPGMLKVDGEAPELAVWGVEIAGLAERAERAEHAPDRAWLEVTVDADLLRGDESSVPDGLVRILGLGLQQRRTFSSRFGPVMLANDGPEPSRGPLRPVALGAGARLGDVLVLGFALEGDVVVEVHPAPQHDASPFLASGYRRQRDPAQDSIDRRSSQEERCHD